MDIPTTEVKDTVPKINNEIAVGEDLAFQRRWWKFEKIIWIVLTLLLVLDVAGVFGRGPAANAHRVTPGGMMDIRYQRVERFGTPAQMTIHFSPSAIQNGAVQLWVSDQLVASLGNQLVIPEPERSQIGQGGILYTFPATADGAIVQFSLKPSKVGVFKLQLALDHGEHTSLDIVVMP